jgi:hypothetical protein
LNLANPRSLTSDVPGAGAAGAGRAKSKTVRAAVAAALLIMHMVSANQERQVLSVVGGRSSS